MSRILAIAVVEMRDALRSRFLASLLVLVGIILVAMPLTVRGDGTVTGEIRVLLNYVLGTVFILMAVATLWLSCNAVSREVAGRQIHLVAVKPVRRWQIWLGKWLAIVLVNALILAGVGIFTAALLQWKLHRPHMRPGERAIINREVLVGRHQVVPMIDSFNEQAMEEVRRGQAEGTISHEDEQEIFNYVRKQLRAAEFAVSPGALRQWFFFAPQQQTLSRMVFDDGAEGDGIVLRYRTATSFRERRAVNGIWWIGVSGRPRLWSCPVSNMRDGVHSISVPFSALPADRPILVTFANAGPDKSSTVVFDPEMSIQLLIPHSGFAGNLARSLVVLWCNLCLLAALGVTAGTVFSFPVATFAASAAVIAALLSNYFMVAQGIGEKHRHGDLCTHGVSEMPPLTERVTTSLADSVGTVIGPSLQFSPLEKLSDGVLVSWGYTGEAVLVLVAGYSLLLALLGALALHRKELGLPTYGQ